MRRLLLVGSLVAAIGVLVRRAAGRARGEPPTMVTPDGARDVVEAARGRRAERRDLTLDFEPATATRMDLLIDGGRFFPSLLEDIEAARTDIHILIFGFKAGDIGDRFRDALVAKVAADVGVRVITEAAFSQPGLGSKAFYDSLVAGGVQVVANQGAFLDLDGTLDKRYIDWRLDDFGHFDHRKVVIVDGRVGYVGGPGIEDHYATGTHDLMVRLEGPIVAQLQAVFLLSWLFQGGPLATEPDALARFFPPITDRDGSSVRILHNNPGEGYLPIRDAFLAAVEGARRRLDVISPYVADHGILRGLVEAARRGVQVRVIVPADPHSLPAKAAVRHWFSSLVEAGADVREHPEMAHAKVVLSDDTVLVGTANLDALSLRQNWEMQLRIEDPVVAELFARDLFDHDITVAAPARLPAGWRERAVNAVMSALSPLL
jgi:cardiolipin synthase A/B